ncbi:hypothetical protein Hrd1104_11420 [Halorhabdus sp. CBA1104]|uniref:hypothetical protein n=1 Tax=Halorhabdus sp. CBA1104 TaxID=1380432 RepID=UPI0012B2A6A1|nr:hypothetical protein [Halorhabdus sp. CBA1104]QGN07850.1 hypothetical protein Hrd1104_11420 [Halorhabdus sp. CBA1104]
MLLAAAGGGGGQDDSHDSQAVENTAPDLEQSSLDQYGEGSLGGGQGEREYAEPSTDEGSSGGDVEGRLDRLESEVSAESKDDPAESYTPGELTVDEAKSMTDNEEMAKTMVAMDQKMASLSEPDESTAMGQEAAKGAVAGAAGAGAGQTVGAALGGIGGSIAGPVGTAAGAALGGAIGGAAGGIGGYAASRMVGEGSVRGGLERVSEATSGVKSKAKETYSYALPGGSGEGESGGGESDGFEGDDYA